MDMVVVHVIPWSPYSFSTPGENERRSSAKDAEIKAATSQIVEPMVEIGKQSGHTVTPVVRHGDPVDTIVALVKETHAVSVTVGRTGDSRVRRAIFGSIPSHLVHECPVPVTVVP